MMSTHIRVEPEMAYLGVGHELKFDLMTIDKCGYLVVRSPQLGESIHILQTWSCPTCKNWPQWAEIVISNERIESIASVPLNCVTLNCIHFIDDEVKDVVAALIGKNYAEIEDVCVIPILREVLTKSPSDPS